MAGPLEELSRVTRREFPRLLGARALTRERLAVVRARLARLEQDTDVAVVLMGSWGRAELTSGSDDDFMVLVDGTERATVAPALEGVRTVLSRAPGDQGVFGTPVYADRLVEQIGLDGDTNDNLTRRMLLLWESAWGTADSVWATVRERLLARYIDSSVKSYRVPRFLLNDSIRYWRTICVDFAAKEREGPEKWGLRNAKLRTGRKLLFASGLLPLFDCASLPREEMHGFLAEQLTMPPTDRVAAAFLRHDAADAGGRALGAYDDFIGMLDEPDTRAALNRITREGAQESSVFAQAAALGDLLENGLLALLFETPTLPALVREYAVF